MRVVIVDDEELARRGIRARLAAWPDIEIVGEAADSEAGLSVLRQLKPDLVFLDVEMPGADGFSVLAAIAEGERPLAIFVTAHDDRALDAFGVQALDYVLKPIDDLRLARAVERARERLAERRGSAVERVMIKDRGRVVALEPSSIDWVQSDGDYVRIFAGRNTYLHHATISAFTSLLPGRHFVRIHRAAVVNVSRIAELQPLTNGDYTVLLTTGARLKLTRTRREQLAERLGASW
ncbi:MAG: LytTR family DNA-binding domain-containing protein [Gemmatimonadaceae bacterium]